MNVPVWRIVAEREITTRIRQKSFLIGVAAMVVGVIAVIVLTSMFGDKPSHYKVATTTQEAQAVVEQASDVVGSTDEDSDVTARRADSESSAEQMVTEGKADVALLPTDDGYRIVGDREVDGDLAAALTTAVQASALQANAEEQQVDLAALHSGSEVRTDLLDPNADNAGARKALAFVMVLLFYMTAIIFGMTIAQSVVQEKESRIVEILAAAVPIRALLWGKVVGNSILAFGQIALVVLTGLVALKITDVGGLGAVAASSLAWFVLFFVLGFVAMAGVWAIAGSLASRQEDLQSTTMPGNLLLLAPYMIAITAGEGVKTVVSMLPITSAMVMPARLAEGDVPWWQLGVAVGSNVLAIIVTVWIGARVYERTLMRTERRLKLTEALRGPADRAVA